MQQRAGFRETNERNARTRQIRWLVQNQIYNNATKLTWPLGLWCNHNTEELLDVVPSWGQVAD